VLILTNSSKDLVDYELSLPTRYDKQVRGFCLYHQKDFDRFSEEQKQRLIEHHGKALKIVQWSSNSNS
jgi:hypothetical protein